MKSVSMFVVYVSAVMAIHLELSFANHAVNTYSFGEAVTCTDTRTSKNTDIISGILRLREEKGRYRGEIDFSKEKLTVLFFQEMGSKDVNYFVMKDYSITSHWSSVLGKGILQPTAIKAAALKGIPWLQCKQSGLAAILSEFKATDALDKATQRQALDRVTKAQLMPIRGLTGEYIEHTYKIQRKLCRDLCNSNK